jgi:hypothetical protein
MQPHTLVVGAGGDGAVDTPGMCGRGKQLTHATAVRVRAHAAAPGESVRNLATAPR